MSHQVQDIEFMQIEITVIEGLKVGNDCLKSMHKVDAFFFTNVLENIHDSMITLTLPFCICESSYEM